MSTVPSDRSPPGAAAQSAPHRFQLVGSIARTARTEYWHAIDGRSGRELVVRVYATTPAEVPRRLAELQRERVLTERLVQPGVLRCDVPLIEEGRVVQPVDPEPAGLLIQTASAGPLPMLKSVISLGDLLGRIHALGAWHGELSTDHCLRTRDGRVLLTGLAGDSEQPEARQAGIATDMVAFATTALALLEAAGGAAPRVRGLLQRLQKRPANSRSQLTLVDIAGELRESLEDTFSSDWSVATAATSPAAAPRLALVGRGSTTPPGEVGGKRRSRPGSDGVVSAAVMQAKRGANDHPHAPPFTGVPASGPAPDTASLPAAAAPAAIGKPGQARTVDVTPQGLDAGGPTPVAAVPARPGKRPQHDVAERRRDTAPSAVPAIRWQPLAVAAVVGLALYALWTRQNSNQSATPPVAGAVTASRPSPAAVAPGAPPAVRPTSPAMPAAPSTESVPSEESKAAILPSGTPPGAAPLAPASLPRAPGPAATRPVAAADPVATRPVAAADPVAPSAVAQPPLNPNSAAGMVAQGDAYLSELDVEAATASYQQALASAPGSRRAQEGLDRARRLAGVAAIVRDARDAARRGDNARAVQGFSQAAAAAPQSTALQRDLSAARGQLGDGEYGRSIGDGYVALGAGRLELAREAFGQAERLRPGDPAGRRGMSQTLTALRLRDEAEARRTARTNQSTPTPATATESGAPAPAPAN